MSTVQPQPPVGDRWPASSRWSATPPKGRGGGLVFATVGIVLAAGVGLLVVGYLAVALGVNTVAIGTALALLPLAVVLLTIRWVDRWEPEPRWALWFAFLWGAAVSVAFALVVDLGIQLAVAFAESGATLDEAMQAVVQAPIVEETAKGVGVQGYCMSGAFAFETAATLPDRIGAVASFHGGGLVTKDPTSPHLLIPKTKARFAVLIAQNDDAKDPQAKDVLKASFAAAGRPAVVEVYPADHGWTVPGGQVYDAVQAERAWSELLKLYRVALA